MGRIDIVENRFIGMKSRGKCVQHLLGPALAPPKAGPTRTIRMSPFTPHHRGLPSFLSYPDEVRAVAFAVPALPPPTHTSQVL